MASPLQFSIRALLIFIAVVAAILGLVVSARNQARVQETRNILKTVGLAYHHCVSETGSPPAKIADMNWCGCGAGALAAKVIKDGLVVVVWNANVRTSENSKHVLGYATSVPTAGGPVLMADGTVKTVTVDEFHQLPKVPTIADETETTP